MMAADTQTTKYGYLNIQRVGMSAAVLLYFLAIIAVNQVPGAVTSAFYYLAIFVGGLAFYSQKRTFGIRPLVLMAMGAGILCIVNTFALGNESVVRSMIMVASFFVAALMLDEEVDERTYLAAIYLNAAVALAHLLLFGRKAAVYAGSSNNYVSIHLLIPAVLYYSLLDVRGKKIPIIPAGVIWVTSLLAGGRGGLIASTLLLAGVLLRRYLQDDASRRERVLLGFVLILILIPVIYVVIRIAMEKLSDLYVIDRFMAKGMDGGGRIACWTEYLEYMGKSAKNMFLGVNLDDLRWVRHYNGNLHNSFLFIHAYMGMAGFVTFMILLIRATVWSIRNKKGIYLCCIMTLCFRGLTDHMFGGNRMSAIVIAMVLIPDFLRMQEKMKKLRESREKGMLPSPGDAERLQEMQQDM